MALPEGICELCAKHTVDPMVPSLWVRDDFTWYTSRTVRLCYPCYTVLQGPDGRVTEQVFYARIADQIRSFYHYKDQIVRDLGDGDGP